MSLSPLSLSIIKRTNLLDGITCYEPVRIDLLNKMIKSNLLVSNFKNPITRDMIGSERKQLEKYKSLYNNDTTYFEVKYVRSKGLSFGRSNPVGAVGLFSMRRRVRHTLAIECGLSDWDIVNAHPTMLLQICKANGLSCSNLEYYISNRQLLLKKLMDTTGCCRDRAKELFLRLLYFGTFENWCNETKDSDGNIIYPEINIYAFANASDFTFYINELVKELSIIGDHIMNANPKLVKEIQKSKEKNNEVEYNLKSSVVSFLLQEYEITILECIYQYCVKKYYILNNVCVLCADGIMLENKLIENADIPTEFNAIVKEKIGFDLTFEKKELDEFYTEEDFAKSKIDASIFIKEKLLRFDAEYFNSLQRYSLKKLYFENFVCKVMRPDPVYIYIENEGGLDDMVFYTQSKLLQTFNHLNSGEIDKFGHPVKFIGKWIDDEDVRCYNKMDFLPINDNTKLESHIFNLFRGFNPLCNGTFDITKRDKLLKPFFDLGLELCGGNQKHFDFLLKYIADIFKNPNKKNPIAFIIKGSQGTGKNVWLNVIGELLGKVHYITSSNPQDFFGDYAEGFYHKLLVNMNECEGKDTFDFEGRIKSFITEDKITLNRKFVQPISISNLARLIIFSNKPNPIPIDVRSKERRYVVYETTDKYLDKKYGTTFWIKLIDHFIRPDFIACLYSYLVKLDIDNFDWRSERPITDAYRNMCKLYIPTEVLFIEHFINQSIQKDELFKTTIETTDECVEEYVSEIDTYKKQGIEGQKLYHAYMGFTKEFGFNREGSFQKNIKSFYSKITELKIPMLQKKPHNIVTYYFDSMDVLKFMRNQKWIDVSDEDFKVENMEEVKGGDFSDYFDV